MATQEIDRIATRSRDNTLVACGDSIVTRNRDKWFELLNYSYAGKQNAHNARFYLWNSRVATLVTPRGPSAKQFWDGLERLDERLSELIS
jgi:hypothetical protein